MNNSGSGATLRERIEVSCDAPDAVPAWADSPKMNKPQTNNAADVTIEQPTRLHLFGELVGDENEAGGSFIAGVIEYGVNLYRHFYLGYVEKITPFSGGEVITGSSCWPVPIGGTSGAQTVSYDAPEHNVAYPFGAEHASSLSTISNGGVFIDHSENAVPFRRFFAGGSWPPASSDHLSQHLANEGHRLVLGGFKDSINTGYMAAGKSPFSGVQILTPINLYIGKRQLNTQFFQAIGRPPGVRFVHMEDLEPGAQVTVGSSVWRVFPVFSKSDVTTMVKSSGISGSAAFPPNNTSYYVGLAYRVSE